MVFNSDFPTFSFPMSHQFAWNPQRIHTRGTGAWVFAVAPRETLTPKKMKAKKNPCTSLFCFHEENNITQKKKKRKPILFSSHYRKISFAFWFLSKTKFWIQKLLRTLGTVKVSCRQRTWAIFGSPFQSFFPIDGCTSIGDFYGYLYLDLKIEHV